MHQRFYGLAGTVVAVLSCLSLACEGAPAEQVCSSQLAIHGATAETEGLLGPAGAAVGALETAYGDVKCSGFVVAPGWVLTAAHCHDELAPLARFVADDGRIRARVSLEVPHEERDVMLVRLLDSDSAGPEPIQLWSQSIDDEWLGRSTLLAGYGEDEAGQRGEMLVVQEPISSVAATTITTDGGESSGACHGDSGGPLLYRDPRGELFALGVLSTGDTACRGIDMYARVDDLASWVQDVQRQSDAAGCAGLSETGHCELNRARYCLGDQPVREVCENHQICGWSVEEQGYRCVDEQADPCAGAAAGGRCDGKDLLTCDEGRVRRVSCGDCAACRVRPSGGAHCG